MLLGLPNRPGFGYYPVPPRSDEPGFAAPRLTLTLTFGPDCPNNPPPPVPPLVPPLCPKIPEVGFGVAPPNKVVYVIEIVISKFF